MASLPYQSYAIALYLAAITSVGIALLSWRRRYAHKGAKILVLFTLAMAIWSTGYAFELSVRTLAAKLLWAKIQYIGIVAVAPLFLIFILQYLGYDEWLNRSTLFALIVVPLLTLTLVWTNEWHHLIWTTVRLASDDAPFPILRLQYGSGFILHTGFSYLCMLFGTLLTVYVISSAKFLHKRQAAILLVGAFPPWLANLVYLLRLSPAPWLDLTPFAFTTTEIALVVGLFLYKLLEIIPIARNTVIEHMGEAMMVFDQENRLIDLNPATERLFGLQVRNSIGQPAAQVLAAWPALLEGLQSENTVQANIWQEIDEQRYSFDVSISPLFVSGNVATGKLLLLHDATAREEAAEMLRQRELELRNTVAQLEELDQLKSSFISHVNHELRTPLTNIRLYVELLQRGNQQKQARYLEVLQRETTSLLTLVETTLDLSRLDAFREMGTMHFQPVDIAEVTYVATTAFSDKATNAEVKLAYHIPDYPKYVFGNYNQLVQVVSNLLNNAINYTPAGGAVKIGMGNLDNLFTITVQDTGIGILPVEKDHIFERFYRSERVINLGVPGIGLGLSIVKEILDLHGGQIEINSTPNGGSTFQILLPCANYNHRSQSLKQHAHV